MVVTKAAGQAEPLGGRHGRFAEERQLIQPVGKVREEQRVRGRAQAARRNSAQILEPGDRHVLAIVAVRAAEERAGHPGRASAATGDAHLLRPHPGGGGIVQRCIQRVDTLVEPEASAGDARRQCTGISNHQQIAIGVRRDRCEPQILAKVVLEIHVPKHEIVGELFVQLRKLAPVAERDCRPRRGERIREDVVIISAIPTVHPNVLVGDARGDGELRSRRDSRSGPKSGPKAVVDVLPHREVCLKGVDKAGNPVVVRHDAYGRFVSERRIEAELAIQSGVAAFHASHTEFSKRLLDLQLWGIRDIAHGAGQGSGAEERPLRSAQHFDTPRVEEIEVWGEQRHRDDGLVEVDAHLLLDSWLIAHDLARGHTAYRDLALSRAQVLHRQSADVRGHPFESLNAAHAQCFFSRRRDRERHVENRLFALGGGDRHLFGQLRVEPEVEWLRCAGRDLNFLHDPAESLDDGTHRVRAG